MFTVRNSRWHRTWATDALPSIYSRSWIWQFMQPGLFQVKDLHSAWGMRSLRKEQIYRWKVPRESDFEKLQGLHLSDIRHRTLDHCPRKPRSAFGIHSLPGNHSQVKPWLTLVVDACGLGLNSSIFEGHHHGALTTVHVLVKVIPR